VEGDKNERNGAINIFDLASVADETSVGKDTLVRQISLTTINGTSVPKGSTCVLSSMLFSNAFEFEGIYVECECKPGYAGDGIRCEEIDECITEFPCPLNETGGFCVDTDPDDDEFPFYKCGCKNGFETLAADEHGATVCGLPGDTLAPTFMPSRADTLMPSITGSPTPVPPIANCTACPEKSECALSTPGAPSAFDNGEGVFIVCLCKEGYTGDGWRCEDINECETEFPCPSNETGGFCVDTDPDDEEFPFYKCGCLEGYAAVDVDEHGASSCEMATEAPSITPVPSTTSFPSGTNAPTLTGTPTLTGIPTLTGFPTLTSTPTGSPTATGIPTLTGTPTLSGSPSLSGSPTLTGKKKRRQ